MIPQLRVWSDRYGGAGLTVVGVHTPEFFWEKSAARVTAATKRLAVSYPVVQDNDYAIWNRFGVRAWPTTVVVDRTGRIRHWQIGEGNYEVTEAVLRQLLAERE